MANFKARPHFEDRQIVQNNDESIQLSGVTRIAPTILDFTGSTTGQTTVTVMGLTGYLNEGREYGFRVEPPLLKISGSTGYTTVDVTGYVLTAIDSDGNVGWQSVSGGTSGGTNTYVTGGTLNGSYQLTLGRNDGSSASPIDLSALSGSTYWTSGSSGNYSVKVVNDSTTDATGDYAVAEGYDTLASGIASHAEGQATTASGVESHAEGRASIASGYQSHAEGSLTTASGGSSHAEGYGSVAGGSGSHAEGRDTFASGDYTHAEGYQTQATGTTSHAEGYGSKAFGYGSHAEGGTTPFEGGGAGGRAYGEGSHAEGVLTIASGLGSHAEGYGSIASGYYSHAEGRGTLAGGFYSHSQNEYTIAAGGASHAGGAYSTASGDTSFIHSKNSLVTGDRSVVLGGQNNEISILSNDSSIIGGFNGEITNSNASVILGGTVNTIDNSSFSSIMGGVNGVIDNSNYSVIGGGSDNSINNVSYAGIYAGYNNTILGIELASFEFIGGGKDNIISGSSWSSIVGGNSNVVDYSPYSSIIGGVSNRIVGALRSVVLGGQNITGTTDNTVYTPNLTVRGNYSLHSDSTLEVTDIPSSFEDTFKGSYTEFNWTGLTTQILSNNNPNGYTSFLLGNLSNYPTSQDYGFLSYFGSGYTRTGSPTTGTDFYRDKMVLKGSDDTDGMVFSLSNGPTGTMWWEIDGESKLILNGDNFGIGLNNDGTESPTNTLHVNGSFRLENGTEQSNYVLTSNSLGVGTWQPISGLTTGLTLSEVLTNGNTTSGSNIILGDDKITSGFGDPHSIFFSEGTININNDYSTDREGRLTLNNGPSLSYLYNRQYVGANYTEGKLAFNNSTTKLNVFDDNTSAEAFISQDLSGGYPTQTILATDVDGKVSQVYIEGNGYMNIYVDDNTNSTDISISPSSDLTVTTTNGKGIEYSNDYSATFTNRSLVDKEYVDGLITGTGNTLSQVLTNGNTTGGNNILISGTQGLYSENNINNGITFPNSGTTRIISTDGVTPFPTNESYIDLVGANGSIFFEGTGIYEVNFPHSIFDGQIQVGSITGGTITSNTFNYDCDLGMTQKLDLQGATTGATITFSNQKEGSTYTLIVVQGSGTYDLTFPSGWWLNDTAPFDFTTLADNDRVMVTSTYLDSEWYFAVKQLTFV